MYQVYTYDDEIRLTACKTRAQAAEFLSQKTQEELESWVFMGCPECTLEGEYETLEEAREHMNSYGDIVAGQFCQLLTIHGSDIVEPVFDEYGDEIYTRVVDYSFPKVSELC